jgi:hypothetical protein
VDPVNSHSAEVPSVIRIPSAAAKPPGAVISSAQTVPARKASGGHTTTLRRPLAWV